MRIIVVIFLIFMFCSGLLAGENKSDSLVAQAWKFWELNNQQQVEQSFHDALSVDPNNLRACIGLSYLYEFQHKDAEAWNAFRKIPDIEKNYYPYLYASWFSPKFDPRQNAEYPGLLEVIQRLTTTSDAGGTLKAKAWAMLGGYYELRGDFVKSRECYSHMNAIRQWNVIGPFQNVSASGYDKVFSPEAEFDTAKTYVGKNEVPCKWFTLSVTSPGNWIDFLRYFAYTDAIFYANNFLYSPKEQTVQIRIGTSGCLKAFLNDDPLVTDPEETNNDLDTYIMEVNLQKGWNRLLLKVGYSDISRCNFLVRVTDPKGDPIEGLQIETAPQQYTKHPGIHPVQKEIFAEAFFKEKIRQDSSQIENYVLLAETYLKNGKTNIAELTLLDGMKLFPDCALLYSHIWKAYRLGQKNDEAIKIREKMYTLDKKVPEVLEDKISDAIDKEDLDKAEEFITELQNAGLDSEKVIEYQLGLYGKRKQRDKIADLNHAAYRKYPTNLSFTLVEANLSTGTTKNYDQAISIMQNYLRQNYDVTGLRYLSAFYLYASQIDKGFETFKKVFDFDPASPGFYSLLTDMYTNLQDYPNAEKAITSAINICPNSSLYWSKLGNIYSAQHREEQAKQCYRLALTYDPTDYDSRDRLRELDHKRSVFSNFTPYAIDSLIASAPSGNQYPKDGAIILLDDYSRVVYPEGTSEILQDELIKVFNSKGIDAFKEYWLSYNTYNQKLLIDESSVIKPDGSKVKADVNDNHIVFKSLEANDIIHIKWKTKNYYSGILAKYFWDANTFNGFFPVKISRYGLLVPDSVTFQYRTTNSTIEPAVSSTSDGKKYEWTVMNDSAVQYENGMSFVDDAAKMLYISNIRDWNTLIDWYTDITSSKTRSSYEIQQQVAQLMGGRKNLSEDEKITIIYNFITENIHYSYVPFRQSAFVPQKARDVLVNRIGDCKDLATLGMAMLKETGIQSNYVLVNTKDQGFNKNALPTVNFNHCILAAQTQKGIRYLDLTAENYPSVSIPDVDVDAFSLLIQHGSSKPFYIPQKNFAPRNVIRNVKVAVLEDNSISLEQKVSRTGALTSSTRSDYRHKDQQQHEKELTEDLSQEYPGVHVNKYVVDNADSIEPTLHYVIDFDVPRYATESGRLKLMKIPWRDKLRPSEALSYQRRNYPLYYWTGTDTLNEVFEISIPRGYMPEELVPKVSYSSPIADYLVTYKFSKGIVSANRKFIQKRYVVLPEEYSEFKRFYNNVLKEDEKQIVLRKSR